MVTLRGLVTGQRALLERSMSVNSAWGVIPRQSHLKGPQRTPARQGVQ